ncbi:CLIP-associating protein, putative [Phytophthora infestans T30-4]|uniref:CLIP-associating protein, putative n=1 Tax=Phytophthora infestans (strain T30-4) TaxID=403677 RepID=D0N3V3_PHYIT|nr:CLIP-associating protein, putative [Phytophthora infestans T30-4]EEY69057.1 CLIP-associating protein, putative [Phytophthora infestans T30-4]|eukprot:XP_002998911.1 CLIP-associating protein, putative [Phytophthora infestans T30-4]
MNHKNWRTREQSLHAVWRCLERHNLFKAWQDELLDDVSTKVAGRLVKECARCSNFDVGDLLHIHWALATCTADYRLVSDLECKSIRAAHTKTLTERFEQIPVRSKISAGVARAAPSCDAGSSSDTPVSNNALPDDLSILSSYDLQVSSSSSSMARYLVSVQSRTLSEAKVTATSAEDKRSPSQVSPTSSQIPQDFSAEIFSGADGNEILDKELQRQLGVIYDKLERDSNWDKRVDGLKMLQKLANRCSKALNREDAVPLLSQGLRAVRERLCQQVSDLRSSVSREACQTIQKLANILRDEFNSHAEICLGSLLKATYVTIQVISTAADTTIKSMIGSTSNGYARVIPKQADRMRQISEPSATIQRRVLSDINPSTLERQLPQQMFVPIMPAILQDALGDVRAQSRECYWSYQYLFPNEAKTIFARLDRSTQKNLNDDPSKFTAKTTRQADSSSMGASTSQSSSVVRSALRTTDAAQPAISAAGVVAFSDKKPREFNAEGSVAGKLPMRVLEGKSISFGVDSSEENVRLLSQGPMRVGLAARTKTSVSKDGVVSSSETQKIPAGPLRVLNAPKPPQPAHTSRQEPPTAGFHTSSQQQLSKALRIQLEGEAPSPVPMDIDDVETRGPKRLPLSSMPSPTASNASSSRTNNSKSDSGDIMPKRIAPEAIRNVESSSWSTRLEAAEYIGKYLEKRVDQIESGAIKDYKLDGRIQTAFIKHLSDSHYRVSQGVLKNLLPLLKLSNDCQRLLPHLKTVLPKLFQKFINTKESIRDAAKENLEYIASTFDSSTLVAIVISLVGDGSNMKIKAAICHYLRELLPGAEGYMKHGTNNSHMRSFLLKIALLMDTDVPVSVSSACGELISIAAQLYGPEMEVALGLLPPSKRLVVSKILKSKKILLNSCNPQRPPFSSSSTAPHSTRSRGEENDNQEVPPPLKPERSRKRVESPSVTSSSPAQNSQKRINTTFQKASPFPKEGLLASSFVAVDRANEMAVKTSSSEDISISSGLFASVGDRVNTYDVQLEDILHILEQNNLPASKVKHVLHKALNVIETGSTETWDRCFGRLLLLLLDAATDNNLYALKVLQRLVEAQPSRAQVFFELLLQRLIGAMVDQVDVARHLIERILRDLIVSASDYKQTLSVLIQWDSDSEPPTLQVVLRLIKVCFENCERGNHQESAFLLKHDVAARLMGVLTRRLDHASSSVRKNAVDCLVAFHFAMKEDSSIVPKYLATELDDTRRRLVEIFIDRAKTERHRIGLTST